MFFDGILTWLVAPSFNSAQDVNGCGFDAQENFIDFFPCQEASFRVFYLFYDKLIKNTHNFIYLC